ncbi:retrovirus-related pol polyprotein from transposon TNT 1-94 [Tanacetum coccineum]
MPSSEQLSVVNQSKTEITSDSNIIPYSQYVIESQQAVVQNSNSSTQQDALILSVIEQLKPKYKEQVKVLKEGQNVDLKSNDNVSDTSAQSVEIDRLKQTLSEHLKEKESLMQTVSLLKNNFKKEESRNIDREIALEKMIKLLDNIVFKRDQSAQTIHMLTKPQFFYDHTTKQALEKKVNTTPVDYTVLNKLSQDLETRFVPQTELSAKQAFWSKNSVNSSDPTPSSRPTKVEVPKELPKVSMVNKSLKKLKNHLAGFDMVVKERTTATTITEGSWGDNSVSNQSAPCFDQYFELNKLKAQSQEKDTAIKKLKERIKSLSRKVNEDKIKKDLEEIETINIELDLREKVLVIIALKEDLRKLKGKALVDNVVTKHSIDPKTLKIDVEPITLKLLNNRTAHSAYIKHTQEEAAVLRDLVKHVKANYPLDHPLDSPLDVTPKNKDKRVRFIEPVTSSRNTKTTSSSNIVSNKPALSSTRVIQSTSAIGSQPSGNTKKDKIQRPSSNTLKNKVEAHPRTIKSSLKNNNSVVEPKGTTNVQHSKLNANSKSLYVKCNGCMLSNNHDLCVLDFINNVNARNKSKSVKKNSKRKVWKPTGKAITTTTEVPPRKLTALKTDTSKPVTTLVYSRKPRKSKVDVPVSKPKILKSVVQIVLWYLDSSCSNHMTGDRSQLTNFINTFLGTVKFRNDHMAKIMRYGDYQIRNVMISRVYYVEGLGHNLFPVRQFCDSNLEVAFSQHTCFIRNLEGVYLLTGSRGNNLYTLSLRDMMASSPICLLSKASKTMSWLWYRCLSHLNFATINHLARHGLVRGLPELKFEKDHLCSACAMGKSKKKPHKPKSEDTYQEKLYLLHMDLCGPMRVTSVNEKKYILVIVDDYS